MLKINIVFIFLWNKIKTCKRASLFLILFILLSPSSTTKHTLILFTEGSSFLIRTFPYRSPAPAAKIIYFCNMLPAASDTAGLSLFTEEQTDRQSFSVLRLWRKKIKKKARVDRDLHNYQGYIYFWRLLI